MNRETQTLEEAAVALESLRDDLHFVVQDGRGRSSMESQIAVQRWNALAARFGFESVTLIADMWDVIKRTAAASKQRFHQWVETVRIYLDRTGGLALDRLRKQLDNTSGDDSGQMFIDQSLADRLAVDGRVPSDFHDATARLLDVVNILERILPTLVRINHDLMSLIGKLDARTVPQDPAAAHALIMKMVQTLNRHPTSHEIFPSHWHTHQFVGGRKLLSAVTYEATEKSAVVKDAASLRLFEALGHQTIALATKGRVQKSINPRLRVLSRSECRTMIDHGERLTDALYGLVRLLDRYEDEPGSRQVIDSLDVLEKTWAEVGVRLETEDRHRLKWVVAYFDRSVDVRDLLERATYIIQEAHKAYVAYIEASLKRFK